MAGWGKRKYKKKKIKPKQSKTHATPEQPETVNSGVESDGNKESEIVSTWVPDSHRYSAFEEDELKMALYKKIELQYQKAVGKLLALNYSLEVATDAVLRNGSITGSSSIYHNNVANIISYINSGNLIDADLKGEPIFEDMSALIVFSMQSLINVIALEQPSWSMSDAIRYLLSNESLFAEESGCSDSKDEWIDTSSAGTTTMLESEIGTLLKENTNLLRRMNLDSSPSSDDHPGKGVAPFITSKENSDQKMDMMMMELANQVEDLRAQLKETKEWAQKRVIQVAKRLNDDLMELRKLKLEKLEKERLKKTKEGFESGNPVVVDENEESLRRISNEIVRLNESKNNVEAQNLAIKAETAAFKLSASEYEKTLTLVKDKERTASETLAITEKEVDELKIQIEEEKKTIFELETQLLHVTQAEEQAKLRLMREREAKEQARLLYLEEERINREAKEESRKRLAAVQQELEAKQQGLMDEIRRLEHQLPRLSAPPPPGKYSRSASSSGGRKQRRRLCLICNNKQVNVVFLPCAHQVMCADCDSMEEHCPCCEARIEKRVTVKGPRDPAGPPC